ncbi:peptide/nickel transport system substrate-binding protein [Murinocardiopsis flavida]|uniref:Peptide/nickel transport system substrate-binding protein n=1 Tax=Murinocardiopsis flavida TaxID=645275 RepID=A0A2P8D9B8_9ACTN|nr:ABC transporter substrate-binding protein [Murinocardiopsis flavida]PSK93809.1 peptide/nickel transport system substrate-binding protein [Murinocardiopsis flavida]
MARPADRITRRDALRLGGATLSALALPGLLAGCGGAAAGGGSDILRLAQSADPQTLDPQKQGDMVSMNVLVNIFDTLTAATPQNTIGPGLALSWTALDPKTWRFRLRRGVAFHNGEPCGAEAVKFSIERLLDPETRSPIVELRFVEGATVVDPYTVDLHTSEPDPILPAKVSLFGGVILPPKLLAETPPEEFARAPVGTGPFVFESWRRAHEVRLRANTDHWNGPPGVGGLVFRPMPNAASSLAAMQSDELDIVTGLTPDAALQLDGYPGMRIESHPGIRTAYLSLDTEDGPLRHRKVRQALNHAVNVPLLIEAVLDGKARELPTMIPRESFGFDKAVEPYTRDVGTAKRLLADAGYPDGFATTITASNEDANVAEAISGLLAEAGVRAKVALLDPGTYSTRLTSANKRALGPIYLAASTGWTMDGQSLVQSNVRSDRRQSRWDSAEADALIDAQEQSVDPEEREEAFAALQRLLKKEAPFVFLYQLDNIYARNARPRWEPGVTGSLTMASAELEEA